MAGYWVEAAPRFLTRLNNKYTDFQNYSIPIYQQIWASKLFFKNPQATILRILGLIPPLQIRKVLRCASLQIENPQVFYINQQTRKFLHCTTLSQNSPKIQFKTSFYLEKNWITALYAIFVTEKKVCICGLASVLSP